MRFSARSHTGHVREVNEDAILALPDHGIWVVSDGMGGHEAGDFASLRIVETIALVPKGLSPADNLKAVRQALETAHSDIHQESIKRGGVTIGATVIVLIVASGHFVCLWAGDSRLYRMRNQMLEQVSQDHTVIAQLISENKMTASEANKLPQNSAITNAIGVGKKVEIEKRRGETTTGDRFLLCSDGLSSYAEDSEIEEMLTNCPIETVADVLMQTALDAGGADNISIIVVDA